MLTEKIWQGMQDFARDERGGAIDRNDLLVVTALLCLATGGFGGSKNDSILDTIILSAGDPRCSSTGFAFVEQQGFAFPINNLREGKTTLQVLPEKDQAVLVTGERTDNGNLPVSFFTDLGEEIFALVPSHFLGEGFCLKKVSELPVIYFESNFDFAGYPAQITKPGQQVLRQIDIGDLKLKLTTTNQVPDKDLLVFPNSLAKIIDYLNEGKSGEIDLQIEVVDAETIDCGGKDAAGCITGLNGRYKIWLARSILTNHTTAERVLTHELVHLFTNEKFGPNQEADHELSPVEMVDLWKEFWQDVPPLLLIDNYN